MGIHRVSIEPKTINTVAGVKVLRTLYDFSLEQSQALAKSLIQLEHCTLVDGVDEEYAERLVTDLAEAGVNATCIPSDQPYPVLWLPLSPRRKTWKQFKRLV